MNDVAPTFGQDFEALTPLIREEWPQVEAAALAATAGDFDKVVALIAQKTEHSKTLVKRQLAELRSSIKHANGGSEITRLRQMVERLQAKSHEISGYVKSQMLTDAQSQMKEHPLVTLLMAIGLGFVIGFVLRGLGRDR